MKDQKLEEMTLDERIAATTAPKVTPERLRHVIDKAEYHKLGETLTICVLTLRNGFTVTGESACASPENYDQSIGEELARKQAEGKIWALEAYLLKQYMFDQFADVRTAYEDHSFASI